VEMWILIFVHPGSRIQKQQQKRGLKKNFCPSFSVATNIKIENYFISELVKKKIWANFQRIKELFTQKISSLSSQKYWFGIRDPEKTYSVSRIRIRNTSSY
jgi:hypothetical protein